MSIESQIKRLAESGLVDPDALDDNDRNLLEQLTEQEVTLLIQIATRFYPGATSLVKVADLRERLIRICVPL